MGCIKSDKINNMYIVASSNMDKLKHYNPVNDNVIKDEHLPYFYKTVNIDNYFNLYKNMYINIYKDIPDELEDKFKEIQTGFKNRFYMTKYDVYVKYANIFTVVPIVKEFYY